MVAPQLGEETERQRGGGGGGEVALNCDPAPVPDGATRGDSARSATGAPRGCAAAAAVA